MDLRVGVLLNQVYQVVMFLQGPERQVLGLNRNQDHISGG